jgi:uncharacterized protein (DUF2237 family)
MILARRKPPKMGLREISREVPAHRAFVRRHVCAVPGCTSQQIEAHHVRKGLPTGEQAGMGEKPHDKWCVSLCRDHHQEAHDLGEMTFSAKHGLDLVAIAKALAAASPHRKRWEG